MRRLLSLLAATALMTMGLVAPAAPSYALDDGLALTPPMGFNNWNFTLCDALFNESLVKEIADLFVSHGLKRAGYQYVNIDDCWALQQRDAGGNLVPDPVRFPNGIKALADYVHGKGLRFGIYASAGTKGCNPIGVPGSKGHEQRDAALFAEWGVDYLKYDNCNNVNDAEVVKAGYRTMRDALKATGRPIVFSISEWGRYAPWSWAPDVGHSWRVHQDVNDNWPSVLNIIHHDMTLAQYAGPGHWNDADMLQVGNGALTDTEYRSHFGLWAILASPLLIGTDLRKATPATWEILTNTDVIAVNQDALGKQATVLSSEGGRHVLVKPLANGERAVALFNETDVPQRISTTAQALGLAAAPAYRVRDLWSHIDNHTAGTVAATVPPHGTAMFRVGHDSHWPAYAPAVDLNAAAATPYPDGPPLTPAGADTTATTTLANAGVLPILKAHVKLTAPAGWQATATSPVNTAVLPGKDKTFTSTWTVRPPAGTAPGTYQLPATATYRTALGRTVTAKTAAVVVVPAPAPPAGTAYLSALPWLKATNGLGPVEVDQSNGLRDTNDGNPITINGVVYPRGLGVNADSSVAYYTGGACTAMTAAVGVDDEAGTRGTVAFEVWADDQRVAQTGVLTNAMAATPLTADVTGATVVTLVVTDGGDGTQWDHADWADARITCL